MLLGRRAGVKALIGLLGLIGCSEARPGAPELISINPGTVPAENATPVELEGSEFLPRPVYDVDEGTWTVTDDFTVSIRSPDGTETVLDDVERMSTETLIGSVPGGLSPGLYDLRVRGAYGDSPWLPEALRISQLCDPSIAELVACYRFEEDDGASTLRDESQYENDITVGNASFVSGIVGRALQGSAAFDSQIADSASLDVTAALTIELWVRPDAPVTAGRQGLFDNNGQYGFFILSGDQLSCTTSAGPSVSSAEGAVVSGKWQHVACVYDGTAIRLFVDGVQIAEQAGTGEISTGGTAGAAIAENSPDGDELLGAIDSVRVWSVGRTRTELCDGANLDCP